MTSTHRDKASTGSQSKASAEMDRYGITLPVLVIASIVGVWLFSVQRRGERTQWRRHAAWDPTTAALKSSTYLRLPGILRWFTGNIGFHHVHHLNPRVPHCRLQECHERIATLCDVPTLSFCDHVRALGCALWDEARGRMVTFRQVATGGARP